MSDTTVGFAPWNLEVAGAALCVPKPGIPKISLASQRVSAEAVDGASALVAEELCERVLYLNSVFSAPQNLCPHILCLCCIQAAGTREEEANPRGKTPRRIDPGSNLVALFRTPNASVFVVAIAKKGERYVRARAHFVVDSHPSFSLSLQRRSVKGTLRGTINVQCVHIDWPLDGRDPPTPFIHSLNSPSLLVHAIDTCLPLAVHFNATAHTCHTPFHIKPRERRTRTYRNLHLSATIAMKSESALFFAALGGVVFSSGADAAAGGFFASSSGAVRPRARGFLPGWGLPRHESVLDRVSSDFLQT